ncbi:MAG: MFS transporter [Erysipelotrichaceae bacterium]|nr:MFS transporter [Erysipelotrichaceae bacterium]
MKKENKRNTYILLVAGLCCAIAAGIGVASNTAGVFLTPMAEELGANRATVSSTVSLTNVMYAIGGLFTVKVLKENNLKKIILISLIAVVSSTVLISLSAHLWQLYLFQAVKGFFTGLLGTVYVTLIINRWFFKDSALIVSIVMGCSGVAGALTSPLLSALIETHSWRFSMMVSAAVLAVLYGIMLLCPAALRPETLNMEAYGAGVQEEAGIQERQWIELDFVNSVLPVVYAGLGGLILAIVQHLPSLAQTRGFSASLGATMLSMAMLTNTAGKIVAGRLIDRIGIRPSVTLISCVVVAGILLILFSHVPILMIIASLMIGMSYSITTVGVAMMVKEAVGMDNYTKVYPSATMATTVAYAIGATMVGVIYDLTSSYAPALYAMLLELLLMFVISEIIGRKKQ